MPRSATAVKAGAPFSRGAALGKPSFLHSAWPVNPPHHIFLFAPALVHAHQVQTGDWPNSRKAECFTPKCGEWWEATTHEQVSKT